MYRSRWLFAESRAALAQRLLEALQGDPAIEHLDIELVWEPGG
ncbi:MAG TPA: hypothetical protein VHT91_41710 [Kofleriaceae bacterium]|nr:hypothetical protein [Kofleriaceae bacterium]